MSTIYSGKVTVVRDSNQHDSYDDVYFVAVSDGHLILTEDTSGDSRRHVVAVYTPGEWKRFTREPKAEA